MSSLSCFNSRNLNLEISSASPIVIDQAVVDSLYFIYLHYCPFWIIHQFTWGGMCSIREVGDTSGSDR